MGEVGESISNSLADERKDKFLEIIKKKRVWIFLILALIIILSISIRTQNITNPINSQGLKDVVTGEWTLGPDLDPWLFLRWSEGIVNNGKLVELDTMRYVPLGYDTSNERPLLPYAIAGVYYIISIFKDISIRYAAVISPVIFFSLTILVFFLFVRQIFRKKKARNIIALISTAFFAVIPTLISRTVAGIPEKESLGFLFIFLTFYFFILAWNSDSKKKLIAFSFLAGISTMLMALTWGGMAYILYTIPTVFFILFLMGYNGKKELLIFSIWMFTHLITVQPFYAAQRLDFVLTTIHSSFGVFIFFVLLINFLLFKTKLKDSNKIRRLKQKTKLPDAILSIIITIIIGILGVSVLFGPKIIVNNFQKLAGSFLHPFGTERFTLTVAENRQPYFSEIASSYGPAIKGFQIMFWMLIVGSIYLFSLMVKKFGLRKRIILTSLFSFFIAGLLFSRFSPSSAFNGTNFISNLFYFGSAFIFIAYLGYLYFKNKGEKTKIDFSYILLIVFFVMTLYASRGAIRLVMVIAPLAVIFAGFLIYKVVENALKKDKEDINKIIAIVLAIILILAGAYTFYSYYNSSKNAARSMIPSGYNHQWQKAMAWIRENTNENAVFAHWWDYGYWVQSIGERATILDGGNAIVYWDHLMGRHVLTGKSEKEALDFLYSHNATHLLIDSTDIGKYPAFSSIGSDENYDRYSYLPIFQLDESQTVETSTGKIRLYRGGFGLDEDLLYKKDGKDIFLPAGNAAIGAVRLDLEKIESGEGQPEIIIIYKNNQEVLPLRYIYLNGNLYDFKQGYEGCLYIMPSINGDGINWDVNEFGAGIFLSPKVFEGNLANLYLFDAGNRFDLVHSEDSLYINDLKKQGIQINDIVLFQGQLVGPIKIWKINYPSGMSFDEKYLELDYPDYSLKISGPIY